MSTSKSLLRSLVAIGAAGTVAAFGTFSAFSSTTENPDNQITAGTVSLSDNDSGSALYDISGAKPGSGVDKCITVTYGGDLASSVRMYIPETVSPLGEFVDLTVTAGSDPTPAFGDCTGFVADADGALFSGTLEQFQADNGDWSEGLADTPANETAWTSGKAVTYRVQVSVRDDNDAQGLATGTHRVVWEARNN